MGLPHKTRPVQVWVDIDLGIAEMVVYLNIIPGVRTHPSCQGTIGKKGYVPRELVRRERCLVAIRVLICLIAPIPATAQNVSSA